MSFYNSISHVMLTVPDKHNISQVLIRMWSIREPRAKFMSFCHQAKQTIVNDWESRFNVCSIDVVFVPVENDLKIATGSFLSQT